MKRRYIWTTIGLITMTAMQSYAQTATATATNATLLNYGVLINGAERLQIKWTNGLNQVCYSTSVIEKTSTNILGIKGVCFGFEYIPLGEPTNGIATITVVKKFPSGGLKDPKQSAPIMGSRQQWLMPIGEKAGVAYKLDEDWEIVPGLWIFEIWSGPKKLLEKTFELKTP